MIQANLVRGSMIAMLDTFSLYVVLLSHRSLQQSFTHPACGYPPSWAIPNTTAYGLSSGGSLGSATREQDIVIRIASNNFFKMSVTV